MEFLLSVFYDVSQLLLIPVLILIYSLFLYSIFELGRFASLWWNRHRSHHDLLQFSVTKDINLKGYPIINFHTKNKSSDLDEAELYAHKLLEPVRVVTRVTPMLGLIATLIPMGPALVALSENNPYGMSEHLQTAFTAVILGLASASITFWIASIKKRWFAEELTSIKDTGEGR